MLLFTLAKHLTVLSVIISEEHCQSHPEIMCQMCYIPSDAKWKSVDPSCGVKSSLVNT